MRNLGKQRHYISGKNYCFLPEFPIAFARNFSYSKIGGGGVPPCPPPASYAYAVYIFNSNQGGGVGGHLCPMPVTVVQPGFVNGRAPKRGEGVGNLCMKTAFSLTLNVIIRGSKCRGIDQFLTLPFYLLQRQRGGGGWGGWALVSRSYMPVSSDSGAARIVNGKP